jgi:hypothetical protein
MPRPQWRSSPPSTSTPPAPVSPRSRDQRTRLPVPRRGVRRRLVALAFAGQTSRAALYTFELILFPVPSFLGLVTFESPWSASLAPSGSSTASCSACRRIRGRDRRSRPVRGQAQARMAGGGARPEPQACTETHRRSARAQGLDGAVLGRAGQDTGGASAEPLWVPVGAFGGGSYYLDGAALDGASGGRGGARSTQG